MESSSKNDGQWSVDSSRLTDLRIPPTLTGVLQARLDALPPTERELLQRASVVGRVFWDDVVSSLKNAGEPPLQNIPDALTNLNNRELIRQREDSVFDGTKEYIFRHTILHRCHL